MMKNKFASAILKQIDSISTKERYLHISFM